MNISAVSGCCAGFILHNLGGQHGHARSINQEEFDIKLRCARYHSGIILAITNEYQKEERAFLEKAGFKTVRANNQLSSHTIAGNELTSYLFSREKALDEYEAKKRAERAAAKPIKSKFAPVLGTYQGMIRLADVQEIIRRFPNYTHERQARILLVGAIRQRYFVTIDIIARDNAQDIRNKIYRAVARHRRGGY